MNMADFTRQEHDHAWGEDAKVTKKLDGWLVPKATTHHHGSKQQPGLEPDKHSSSQQPQWLGEQRMICLVEYSKKDCNQLGNIGEARIFSYNLQLFLNLNSSNVKFNLDWNPLVSRSIISTIDLW